MAQAPLLPFLPPRVAPRGLKGTQFEDHKQPQVLGKPYLLSPVSLLVTEGLNSMICWPLCVALTVSPAW